MNYEILIQVLYSQNWQPIADVVVPVISEYATKHEYDIWVVKYSDTFSGFKKIEQIIEGIPNYKAIWSIDMDTLITNKEIKIESFIDDEHNFFICKDFNGINAGSFIVRNSVWSNTFLTYLLNKQGKPKMECEQNAIEEFIEEFPNHDKIKILPHPSINSYLYENYPECGKQTHETGQWEKGDLLLHLPGLPLHKRLNILNQIKDGL
jgi:hypothetical protein